jgi:hypothetical protein
MFMIQLTKATAAAKMVLTHLKGNTTEHDISALIV